MAGKQKIEVLDSGVAALLSKYYEVDLTFMRSDYNSLAEDLFSLYKLWASNYARYCVYKMNDDNNELPSKPSTEWLMSTKSIEQMIKAVPMTDETVAVVKQAMNEARDIIANNWRKEVNVARLLVRLFDMYRTADQTTPIYTVPYQTKRDDNIAMWEHLVSKIHNIPTTDADIKRIQKTASTLSRLVYATEIIRFKNAAVINGELIYDNDPRFEEYPVHCFKVVSDLEIPSTPDPRTIQIMKNYCEYNPEVHDNTRAMVSRPHLYRELAWAVYSTFAMHTIGDYQAPFGGFFLYEDNDGTGGSRGKSFLTQTILRIANSGSAVNSMLKYGQSYSASSITIPQVQIIAAKNLVNVLLERQGGAYSDDELSFIKAMREESNNAVGKYQIQAQNTTFKGAIFTSSNYIPRFKENSDAVRDRFYGIEFTLKFANRNDDAVLSYTQTDEHLGSVVAWAFSDEFKFHLREVRNEMTAHFKQGYDLLAMKNNAVLHNFHDVLSLKDDKQHEEYWIYDEQHNLLLAPQSYFKYQFAFNAGSVEGSRLTQGRISPHEPQYRSWMAFEEYLNNSLDGKTLSAINFNYHRRVGKKRERMIAIDLSMLPPITNNGARMTAIEKQWLVRNGYLEEDEIPKDLPPMPPTTKEEEPIMDIDELIRLNTTPKQIDIENRPPTVEQVIEQHDYDLDGDPKADIVYEAEPLTTSDMFVYTTVLNHYADSIIGLLEMNEEVLVSPSRYSKGYGEFFRDLSNIAKSYAEKFHNNTLEVPLDPLLRNKADYPLCEIPQRTYAVGVNKLTIEITPARTLRISFDTMKE